MKRNLTDFLFQKSFSSQPNFKTNIMFNVRSEQYAALFISIHHNAEHTFCWRFQITTKIEILILFLAGLTWWCSGLSKFWPPSGRVLTHFKMIFQILRNCLKIIDLFNISCLFFLLKFFSRLAEAAAEKVFCLRSRATPQKQSLIKREKDSRSQHMRAASIAAKIFQEKTLKSFYRWKSMAESFS